MHRSFFLLFAYFILTATQAFGKSSDLIRWTGTDDPNGSVEHVIEVLNQKLGQKFTKDDFVVQDDRNLAFNHYKRLVQVAEGLPIKGKSIRIWTDQDETVQVEAVLELSKLKARNLFSSGSPIVSVAQLQLELSGEKTVELTQKQILKNKYDSKMLGLEWQDEWENGNLVRFVKSRGQRGYHHVRIDLVSQQVLSYEHKRFPERDGDVRTSQPTATQTGAPETAIPAFVYPIYEQARGSGDILPRQLALLKHIHREIPDVTGDIFAPLKTQHYYDFKYDPVYGSLEAGRAKGYWSMSYIKNACSTIREELPKVENDFPRGMLLQGKYATINIHPDAITKFGPLNFEPKPNSVLYPKWIPASANGRFGQELVPTQALGGKPLTSPLEALYRPATRDPKHNPTVYLNEGFDELQVYYAINTLFDQLRRRGFTDPELSTRPFDAFLFNPDIVYRNNAYYTDDTINFTTYSPDATNYARDNTTIWHELGHGIMDRLMGDSIALADTGGLSEGMADFIAELVIQAVTSGKPFPGSKDLRIKNKTGFYLTNEVHDDGEAYGGSMKDFSDKVLEVHGQRGLAMVTDVVLEAMRLSRDHPRLKARDWFEHLLFADSLGRPGLRNPSELKPFLISALESRNFRMDDNPVASFTLINKQTEDEIVAGGPGSRDHEISVVLAKDKTAHFELTAVLKNTDQYQFHFPVEVRVEFAKGPLQGPIHWVGEEKGPQKYTIQSESDTLSIPLDITGACDEVNRDDGSCVDYAYVQVWNQNEKDRPAAKKRFYLRVRNS